MVLSEEEGKEKGWSWSSYLGRAMGGCVDRRRERGRGKASVGEREGEIKMMYVGRAKKRQGKDTGHKGARREKD